MDFTHQMIGVILQVCLDKCSQIGTDYAQLALNLTKHLTKIPLISVWRYRDFTHWEIYIEYNKPKNRLDRSNMRQHVQRQDRRADSQNPQS